MNRMLPVHLTNQLPPFNRLQRNPEPVGPECRRRFLTIELPIHVLGDLLHDTL